MAVQRSLCHNDDVQTGAAASLLRGKNKTFTALKQAVIYNSEHVGEDNDIGQSSTQMLLPALLWGHLRDEDPVGATGQSRYQGQIPERKEPQLEFNCLLAVL